MVPFLFLALSFSVHFPQSSWCVSKVCLSGHLLLWKLIYRKKFGLCFCVFLIHHYGENRSGGVRVWKNSLCWWKVQTEGRGIMVCKVWSFAMARWGFKGIYTDSWILFKCKLLSVEMLPINLLSQICSFSETFIGTLRIQEKSKVSIVMGAIITQFLFFAASPTGKETKQVKWVWYNLPGFMELN